MKFQLSLVFSTMALLVACATNDPSNPKFSEKIAEKTIVDRDDHRGTITVSSPLQFMPVGWNSVEYTQYGLRGVRSVSEPDWKYQVYIVSNTPEWTFIDKAYRNGKPLEIIRIDTNAADCRISCDTVSETLGIAITAEDLIESSKTGYQSRLYGKRGQIDIAIPAEYARVFYEQAQAVDRKND